MGFVPFNLPGSGGRERSPRSAFSEGKGRKDRQAWGSPPPSGRARSPPDSSWPDLELPSEQGLT